MSQKPNSPKAQPLQEALISLQFHGNKEEPQMMITVGGSEECADLRSHLYSTVKYAGGLKKLDLLTNEEKGYLGKILVNLGRALVRHSYHEGPRKNVYTEEYDILGLDR